MHVQKNGGDDECESSANNYDYKPRFRPFRLSTDGPLVQGDITLGLGRTTSVSDPYRHFDAHHY